MADGWTSLSMLPRDGRQALMTRSVNAAGGAVDLHSPEPGQSVILGHFDKLGVLVVDELVAGEQVDVGGWVPTHWRYPDAKEEEPPTTLPAQELDPPGDQIEESNRDADRARLGQMRQDALPTKP